MRSGSRYTSASRGSSVGSSQGPGHGHGQRHRPLTGSGRPLSVASSRTFGGDYQRVNAAEQHASDDFDREFNGLDEVIMAVNLTDRGTVGCAYYVARSEKLYFMEDVKLGSADTIESRMLSQNAELALLANLVQ